VEKPDLSMSHSM